MQSIGWKQLTPDFSFQFLKLIFKANTFISLSPFFSLALNSNFNMSENTMLSLSMVLTGLKHASAEFAYMRKITTKVDLFSFGIIVMELLTKKRPTGLMEENGLPVSLSQLVEKAVANGRRTLLQVLDPMLASNISTEGEKIAEELLKIALLCTNPDPDNRPNMNEVLTALLKLKREA